MAQAERRNTRGHEWETPATHRGMAQAERRNARGASTGEREHRGRKLRGVRVSEFPKKPANNPQSLRVKPPKSRNSFRLRVHLQVTVIQFMINVLIKPQTTCKLPANVNSGLPNAINVQAILVQRTATDVLCT
jgi:hypothetical protein